MLPTDGSEESNRKEKKFVPSQRTAPTRKEDILHNWEKLLYGPETPHILESFESLEIDMRTFWERKKSFTTKLWDGTLRWAKECIDCTIAASDNVIAFKLREKVLEAESSYS